MHLKIFIGVLILGLVSASPKAAPKPKPIPKPIAKTSTQFIQGYPGAQLNYFPGATSYFGQSFNAQPILGQDAAGYQYDPPIGYRSFIGNFGAQGYPQTSVGNYQTAAGSYYQSPQFPPVNYYQPLQASASNYYRPPQATANNYYQPSQASPSNYYQPPQEPAGNYYQSQLIPVPVAYPNRSAAQSVQTVGYLRGSSVQSLQPPSYNGAARLWPKVLISPLGSPSPVPDSLVRAYYAVSTPSPLSYTSSNNQSPLSTQSPLSSTPQSLIPVPVKVDTRNYFNSDIKSFNDILQSFPVPGSTPAPYLDNFYQQSTLPPPDQRYSQSAAYPVSTSSVQPSPRYPVNYQSTPAPFQVKLLQSTPDDTQVNYQPTLAPTAQASYQSTSASPIQPTYQSTQSPDINQFPQPTAAAYLSYQLSEISSRSPYTGYQNQPTSSSNVGQQFQQQSASSFGPFYKPTVYPNQQRVSVPVANPQIQIRFEPTPPTPIFPTLSTLVDANPYYPNVSVTSKPISIVPTIPTPVKEVIITENTFIPIPTSSPNKIKAKIIKSEYSPGNIGPQYNHIPLVSTSNKYSTVTPFLAESGGKSSYSFSNAPGKSYVTYSPSTAVSHVNFKSLGNSYSY